MSTILLAKAALLTLVRSYASGTMFNNLNSSRDDWRVLDAAAGFAAVIKTEGDTLEADVIDRYGVQGAYQERHLLSVNVTQVIGTGATGLPAITTSLETLVEGLKDYLRLYQKLNATAGVRRAQIIRTTPPGPIAEKPTHYMQRIVIQVDCESDIPDGSEGGD